MKKIFLGRIFPIINIKHIAYDLESVERDSKRKQKVEHLDFCFENEIDVKNYKICIFQYDQNCKAGNDSKRNETLFYCAVVSSDFFSLLFIFGFRALFLTFGINCTKFISNKEADCGRKNYKN